MVDTGRKCGMEVNINQSQLMRVSRRNESLRIKIGNRKLNDVDHFKCLERLARDGYCTREFKTDIVMVKEAFNTELLPFIRKLNVELGKKLVRCNI